MDTEVYNEEEEAAACEDVRRMAETLAPQMSALDDILRDYGSISLEDRMNSMEIAQSAEQELAEEDDDLDDEIQQLLSVEQSLREELEFADDMNALLSPSKKDGEEPIFSPDLSPVQKRLNMDPPDVKPPVAYTLQDHADYLQIKSEKQGGWYFVDMTKYLLPSGADCRELVKDYCLPIPFRKLKRLYSGIHFQEVNNFKRPLSTPAKILQTPTPATPARQTPAKTPTGRTSIQTPASSGRTPAAAATTPRTPLQPPAPPPLPQEEPLPVRTISIRIRSDVLCGAVMDAVHHAFEVLPNNVTTHVSKRQGGHLRGAIYYPHKKMAYVLDVQLCTQKNDDMERRLILRFYHIQDDPEAMNELGQALQNKDRTNASAAMMGVSEQDEHNHEKVTANRHMKQSCSLIQRLMAAQQQGGATKMELKQQSSWLGLRDKAFESKAEMQNAIGKHLESNFKACPSVREENKKATPTIRRLTLPSLSDRDVPLLDLSWDLTATVLDELDNRDCTYNTLSSLPFGQFPSLPTLDVHYCSQLRRLSRESMITHLLKSAKELEDYAKTAEYNCAICITLLEPMLDYYGIPPMSLPLTNKSLQDYPLDYTPPQVSCPPWGSLVMESLNQVAAKTPTGEIDVNSAVRMVYHAFTRQDDDEQAARLGRKNAQVMERLAKLQTHQRTLVQNIRDSHIYSHKSQWEASDFFQKVQTASNVGKDGYPLQLEPAVPLLNFKISLGASTSGTCSVTSNQILFSAKGLPLLGGKTTKVFDLALIDFQIIEGVTSTLLNPFPHTMSIVIKNTGNVVFSFRPSVGPKRLKKFLAIIQSFVGDEAGAEFAPVAGEVVEEDGVVRLSEEFNGDESSV